MSKERVRKKYVIVGTGGRITMFADPLVRDFAGHSALVAFCDVSQVRMNYHQERILREYATNSIATYPAEAFERMLEEQQPNVVIICTVDSTHGEYIRKSVKYGCDVICEKPITTTAEECESILDAVSRSDCRVRVTFNLRWVPGLSQVRRLIDEGRVGSVKHVNLEYMLDTSHGADYFRRWHSDKDASGGLLVHKSTHHFDVVNWLVDSIPERVFAEGGLVFYGKENAVARGEAAMTAYGRYADAPPDQSDPFFLDLKADANMRGLYWEAEAETGYVRDKNVFRDGISIEDSMSVVVRYRNGVVLNYSLNAYCPYEGFRIHISGDRGRIEYEERHAAHLIKGQSDEELAAELAGGRTKRLHYYPLFGAMEVIQVEELPGAHGGGDPLLQRQMFAPEPPVDLLGRNAGHEQGIASAIIGIAANQSMATGLPVRIGDLVQLRPGVTRLSELV